MPESERVHVADVAQDVQTLPDGSLAPVRIDIEALPFYYLAVAHRSPVRSLALTNLRLDDAEIKDVILRCEVESAAGQGLLTPRAVEVPLPPKGEALRFGRFEMSPNRRAVALLEERVPGHIVVTATCGDQVVGLARRPIEFLAHNQWMFLPQYLDSIAAFVQPNSPVLDPILMRARQLLEERTGSGSTEGYQSVGADPDRVHQMAAAIFDSLREAGLAYTDPPASFEGFGQKIRTPDVALAERAATCLDSAVLYASCLLRIGLRAQVVAISGHALVSYWATESGPRTLDHSWAPAAAEEPVLRDRNMFDQLVADGVLCLVETTDFTAHHDRSFADARRDGEQRCDAAPLHGVVDPANSVRAGVAPLPPRALVLEMERSSDDLPVERWAFETHEDRAASPVHRSTGPRLESSAYPPRVAAWLRSLLDLSYNNPLIRLKRGARSTAILDLEVPRGVAAQAEDRLMSAGSLLIRLPTEATSALLAAPEDHDLYAEEVRRSGVLFHPSPAELDRRRTFVGGKVDEANPDVAPARRAQRTEEIITADLEGELDRIMRGLKRRAGDLERQTGANNLFLCIGELNWRADDGKVGAAPLFLIPVRITGSARQGYAIAPDETAEVMPNHALLEKLRETYGITVEALERPITDDAGIDVNELLAGVRSALVADRISDAVVRESLSLAVLDFSSFRLWRDLSEHWETFSESPVLHHLVHTPSEDFADPAGTEAGEELRPLCPIEADESQVAAVRAAVAGQSFVLEGPPGTGKSQTITNLLAACIASGKKVLFVAEKSAALDVVRKRLDAIGLGPFCLELFDKEAKPDHIKRQIQSALDLEPPDVSAEWSEAVGRLEAEERRLGAYRDALHGPGPTRASLWSAVQEQVRLGPGPAIELAPEQLAPLAEHGPSVVEALYDLPAAVGSSTVPSPHPWGLCATGDFSSINLPELTWAVEMLAWARQVIDTQPAEVRQQLDAISEPGDFDLTAQALERAGQGAGLSLAEAAVVDSNEWRASSAALLARADTFLSAVAPLLAVYRSEVLGADLSAVNAAGHAALTANRLGRAKAEREFRSALVPYLLDPNDARSVQEHVALLHQIPALAAEWAAVHHGLTALAGLRLPPSWSVLDPASMGSVREQLAQLPISAEAVRSPLVAAVVGGADGSVTASPLIEALRGAARSWSVLLEQLRVDHSSAGRWLKGRSLAAAWVESGSQWSADAGRFLQLQRWCETLGAVEPLRSAGLDRFADSILSGSVPLEDAADWYLRGVANATVAERMAATALDRFDGRAHDRTVAGFNSRFELRRKLMVDRIPGELVAGRPVPPGRRIGKWGELERHLTSQRRKLSIRKLVEEYGPYVGDLTPCFLMSPDSVARFIPPGSITFDLVVFDEASQIEVPRAVGALGRARAAVVVGDTKQMPPSRFGGSRGAEDESSDGSDLVVTDLESLLEECRESRLPTRTLQCHYRSRHEALIAFSNHHFYEDQLTTFPSPASGATPVGWRRIDGRFRRPATRLPDGWDNEADPWPVGTNLVEARAVVSEILARLRNPATAAQSIGVVTSNLQQRDLIRELLLSVGDPAVAELLDRDDDTSLLVQNLENVQGDERDVILMSIGFAPDVTVGPDGNEHRGRLPMRFGPLNQAGGERRLNVAVTRARAEMVVFCSFDPDEMTVTPDSARGLQLLHAYLQAARDGAEASGDVVGRVPMAADRYRGLIAAALRERGYEVVEDVGLSKFRVDLAVGRPEENGFRVAVLLDGPVWAGRGLAYDRDVLPGSVLGGLMGWSEVIRIWLPMWLTSRDDVLASVDEAVARSSPPDDGASSAQAVPPPLPAGLSVPVLASAPPPPPVAAPPPRVEPVVVPPPRTSGPSVSRSSKPVTSAEVFGDDIAEFGLGVDRRPVGGKEVLDDLPDSAAASTVRAVIDDLVTQLEPVEEDQLCKLVAQRFGLSRVRADRVTAIAALIPAQQVRQSHLGRFVWAPETEPGRWPGVRRSGDALPRKLQETAPEEIRNAFVLCIRRGTEMSKAELFGHVARLFGHERQTAPVKERLEAVLQGALDDGVLDAVGDDTFRLRS